MCVHYNVSRNSLSTNEYSFSQSKSLMGSAGGNYVSVTQIDFKWIRLPVT